MSDGNGKAVELTKEAAVRDMLDKITAVANAHGGMAQAANISVLVSLLPGQDILLVLKAGANSFTPIMAGKTAKSISSGKILAGFFLFELKD